MIPILTDLNVTQFAYIWYQNEGKRMNFCSLSRESNAISKK